MKTETSEHIWRARRRRRLHLGLVPLAALGLGITPIALGQDNTDRENDPAKLPAAKTQQPYAADREGFVAEVDAAIPVVLQPVTPCGEVKASIGSERLLELASRAERRLRDVRVIPQTHVQIGAL